MEVGNKPSGRQLVNLGDHRKETQRDTVKLITELDTKLI